MPTDPAPPAPCRRTRLRRYLGGTAGLLFVALVVREMFSFWTGHPYDFEVWIRTGFVVSRSPSLDPYSSPLYGWAAVPGASFAYNQPGELLPSAAYPPFWPLVLGGLFRTWQASGVRSPFLLYFLFKQPAILGDLLIGVLLQRLATQWAGPAQGRRILLLWALFPYDIVISAIWGQFDSLIAVLLLAALLSAAAPDRSALFGVGIFVKWITVAYLPLELLRNRGAARLWPFAAVVLALGLTALGFAVGGWPLTGLFNFGGFAGTATAISHGGFGGMNYDRILTGPTVLAALGSSDGILFYLIAYVWVVGVVGMAAWSVFRSKSKGPYRELEAMLLVTGVFLLTRADLNEQYFLYLFPLLMLDWVCFHPERRRFFLFLVVLCSAFLLLNNALGIWFAAPAFPGLWTTALNLNAGAAPFPAGYAYFREVALNALSLAITVSLVQMLVLLIQGAETWRPWPEMVLGGSRLRPAPEPAAGQPAAASAGLD